MGEEETTALKNTLLKIQEVLMDRAKSGMDPIIMLRIPVISEALTEIYLEPSNVSQYISYFR